ncbi:hypothetical protein [Wukongibacter sp. M2B1]|uniref:hypothetical protein n=1 Tax=Wukongibacter sp. M2B1 TaxID=3088895 RepID=UPI003D7A9589
MKKLTSKVLIAAIGLSMVLSGCAESAQTSEEVSKDTANKVSQEINEEKAPRKRPDMFGRVKSITGNEVVLEIAEMPDRKDAKQEKKAVGVASEGEKATGDRPQGVRKMELKLTGETATLLIPVGIPITTRVQDGSKEIDLADIYTGVSLQIWFDDVEKEDRMITRVVMMQGRE